MSAGVLVPLNPDRREFGKHPLSGPVFKLGISIMLNLKTRACLCATQLVLAAPVQAADHALTEKKIEAFNGSDIAVGVWLNMLFKQVLGIDRPHSEMSISTLVSAISAPFGSALKLAVNSIWKATFQKLLPTTVSRMPPTGQKPETG